MHHQDIEEVYGVSESSTVTSYYTRSRNDFKSVADIILTPVSGDISIFICDCVRVGKYDQSPSRPILVKLNSSCDVQNILSNRFYLSQTITIKPQLSKNEGKLNQS